MQTTPRGLSERGTRRLGAALVVVQFVLLGTLGLRPQGVNWATPTWLEGLSLLCLACGGGIAVLGVSGLGGSLTPTPVPKEHGRLVTAGAYRYVRHPIYSGLLLAVLGLGLRSGSWGTAAVALGTALFFLLKAAWEERLLRRRYPGYAAYAARVPRFVPRIRGRGPSD